MPMTHGIVRLLLAPMACALSLSAAAAEPSPAGTTVQLEVQRDVIVDNGEPGFVIQVSGWKPDGEMTISAVDTAGTIASIVPADRPIRAPADGNLSLALPYRMQALHPGLWVFLVAGEPGIHQFKLMIPLVEDPTPDNKKWRVDYDAAAAADAELQKTTPGKQ